MAKIISTANKKYDVEKDSKGQEGIVDETGPLTVSLSNVVPNQRPIKKKDIDKFVKELKKDKAKEKAEKPTEKQPKAIKEKVLPKATEKKTPKTKKKNTAVKK